MEKNSPEYQELKDLVELCEKCRDVLKTYPPDHEHVEAKKIVPQIERLDKKIAETKKRLGIK